MNNAGLACAVGLVLVGSGEARADEGIGLEPVGSLDLPFDHSTLALSARGTSPSTFDDGSYRDGSLALRGALTMGELGGVRLLAQFRLESELVDGAMFAAREDVAKGGLGVTALYVSHRADLYALYAGAAVAETPETLAHAEIMPTVVGLATYHTSSRWSWIYGGGFGYALGRSWLLPAAGVSWRPNRDWTVMAILPVIVQGKHAFSRHVAGDVVVSLDGDRFGFANDGAFAGAADRLQLRLAQLRLGIGATYKWSHWSWRAELGVVGPRRLAIADGDAMLTSQDSRGAGFVSTQVSYAFDPVAR